MTTGMSDTWERVVFDVEDDKTTSGAESGLEGCWQIVRMRCDFELLTLKECDNIVVSLEWNVSMC